MAELLRGQAERPFKAVAGAGAKTERSLPPPPGVPALRSPSLSQAGSARTVPVGPSKRLLLLQGVGGLEAPLCITGAGPRAESSAGLRRRRVPGVETEGWWKARLPCSAAGALHPGAPLRGHVRRLTLLSSAVRSLSSQGSPRPVPGAGGQQNEGLGRSKARVPCLPAEVLRKSPSDPGRGVYAGWGPRWASRLRFSGCALGARNGREAGAALGGPRTPLLAGGGALRGAFRGSRLPSLCLPLAQSPEKQQQVLHFSNQFQPLHLHQSAQPELRVRGGARF